MSHSIQPTRRVRLSTGLKCNIRCLFCYYNEELNTQDYSSDMIRKMLDLAWQYGIREIDFSGGEPTTRSDFPDLVCYARDKGFERICVITNGTRIARRSYLEKLHWAGVNEILLSVHSSNTETAHKLSRRNNLHDLVLRSLDNIRDMGIRLRINTVLNQENRHQIVDIARLVAQYNPVAVNLICFNDWVNAASETSKMAVRYSDVAEILREYVNILKKTVSKVTVRYVPFCFLQGLEEHVCGILQNTFDNDEWIDSVKRLVTDMDRPDRVAAYYEMLDKTWAKHGQRLRNQVGDEPFRQLINNIDGVNFAGFGPDLTLAAHFVDNAALRDTYVKGDVCAKCSRNAICDGLHRSYADVIGVDELQSMSGPLITDPMYFRGPYATTWK